MSSSTSARRAARSLAMASAIAAAMAVPAQAYVPAPGNGKQLATNAPDLESATILSADTTDDLPNVIRFCFDKVVDEIPNGTRFYAYTYDANRFFRSGSADVAAGSEKCVDARFGDDLDIGEGTVALADRLAVGDSLDQFNERQTAPLAGTRATPAEGRTTAPDLIEVSRDTAANRVTFRFDEELDQSDIPDNDAEPANGNGNNAFVASRFRLVRSDGGSFGGSSIVNNRASRYTVTVQFGPEVAQAQRYVYDGTGGNIYAVRELATSNGQTYAQPGVVGGTTGLPVLQSAARESAREFRLQYSTDVDPNVKASIVAVTDDGRIAGAQDLAQRSGDSRGLIAQFDGNLVSDSGGVVRIVDLGGAAKTDGAGVASTLGQAVTGTLNQRAGYTAGPDLEAAFFDATLDRITFRFDEDLRQDADFNEGGFYAYTAAPDSTTGLGGTTPIISGREVTVRFPDTIDNAVGAGVAGGTTFDRIGSPTPWGSVSYELEPFPAPPVQEKPVVTPSGTPVPVPVPQRIRYASIVTLKKAGRASRRKYSGRVTSSGRGCRSGRRVVFKRVRGSRTTTIPGVVAFTKGDGTFTLRRKAIRGRVKAFVTERGGRQVFCRSAASRTIRG